MKNDDIQSDNPTLRELQYKILIKNKKLKNVSAKEEKNFSDSEKQGKTERVYKKIFFLN